jgi:S1-C subfamily serine protease
MNLPDIYPPIRRAVVAFVPKNDRETGIIGSGFVVRSDGLVATNRHVIEAFSELEPAPDESWPVAAILFHPDPEGWTAVHLPVAGVAASGLRSGLPRGADLGLVRVHARNLPALTLAGSQAIAEGMPVATAGFPSGPGALDAPGALRQRGPTLQRGIVSAILPHPAARPAAFSIQIMAHGGASGSPIFLPDTGAVAGVLYAALVGTGRTSGGDTHALPTPISYAVPVRALEKMLDEFERHPEWAASADAPTFEEYLCESRHGRRYEDGACRWDQTGDVVEILQPPNPGQGERS